MGNVLTLLVFVKYLHADFLPLSVAGAAADCASTAACTELTTARTCAAQMRDMKHPRYTTKILRYTTSYLNHHNVH